MIRKTTAEIGRILTRTSGFLSTVASHSLQPYRGCAFGNSLCGVGCYVQHNHLLTNNRRWGSFVESRSNSAAAYRAEHSRESCWARRKYGAFGIFLSSSTEPFQPVEREQRITRGILEAMVELPPDFLILQTHSHHVADYLDLYPSLAARTRLRFHVSIETDIERLPGLPPPASSVGRRIAAAAALHAAGLEVVITVSPLLPIAEPDAFFAQMARVADAVVIDHFIAGDGSKEGTRTMKTALPSAMMQVNPLSTELAYRDEIVDIAKLHFPGRVGVNIDGFAGRWI